MNTGTMGGFLSKCKCRSNSGTSDFNDDHREDSLKSFPSPKDEAYEPELQSQEQVKKKNLEKDFYSITVAETLNNFRIQHQWTDFTIGVNGIIFLSTRMSWLLVVSSSWSFSMHVKMITMS